MEKQTLDCENSQPLWKLNFLKILFFFFFGCATWHVGIFSSLTEMEQQAFAKPKSQLLGCVQLSVIPCMQPARPLCPWDSPGRNTGMGCLSLLQGIFPTQGLNPGLQHCRQLLCCLSHVGSPSTLESLLLHLCLMGVSCETRHPES